MKPVRKAIVAVAVSTAVFGAAYGLAASFGVPADAADPGPPLVAACQASPVNALLPPPNGGGRVSYQVTTVTVSGLSATCEVKPSYMKLEGAPGAATLRGSPGAEPKTGGTSHVTPTPQPEPRPTVSGLTAVTAG